MVTKRKSRRRVHPGDDDGDDSMVFLLFSDADVPSTRRIGDAELSSRKNRTTTTSQVAYRSPCSSSLLARTRTGGVSSRRVGRRGVVHSSRKTPANRRLSCCWTRRRPGTAWSFRGGGFRQLPRLSEIRSHASSFDAATTAASSNSGTTTSRVRRKNTTLFFALLWCSSSSSSSVRLPSRRTFVSLSSSLRPNKL